MKYIPKIKLLRNKIVRGPDKGTTYTTIEYNQQAHAFLVKAVGEANLNKILQAEFNRRLIDLPKDATIEDVLEVLRPRRNSLELKENLEEALLSGDFKKAALLQVSINLRKRSRK